MGDEGPEELARLAVEVLPPKSEGEPPVFALLSDGRGSYWHDAVTAFAGDRSHSGFFVRGNHVLTGWKWWLESDSTYLDSRDLQGGVVRPDFVVRSYVEADTSGFFGRLLGRIPGEEPATFVERVTMFAVEGVATMPDGSNSRGSVVLSVEVPDSLGAVGFFPEVDAQASVRTRGNVLVIRDASGAWLAVSSKGANVRGGGEGENPGASISLQTPGNVVVAVADSEKEAVQGVETALGTVDEHRNARGQRLVDRLRASPFVTEDEHFNKAFQWALLTLDALVVRDSARASLLLGLPGLEANAAPAVARFLPAFLMTGAWEDASGVLLSLADAQRFDRRIDLLGRAPNAAPPFGEPVFATADATPLFIGAAGEVVRATGARGLVAGNANFWYKTVFALRGLYEPDARHGNPVSEDGFLVAREGYGTWADGQTPRYGVPVEGQPALLSALQTARAFAEIMGVASRSSSWYADSARALEERFYDRFVLSDYLLADRLQHDGQPVDVVGPSSAAALALLPEMNAERRAEITRTVAERLGLKHGIATRAQSAEDFYPYLEESGMYTEEEALFSGDVWTWLTGPMVTAMAQTGGHEAAYTLTTSDTHLLLERGTVGGIPERLAGHPRSRSSEPAMGGAPVQPFSLAGFLQAAYEGYLGARYASASELVIAPHLPEAWGQTDVAMRLGEGSVLLRIDQGRDHLNVFLLPEGSLPADARVRLNGLGREVLIPLTADSIAVDMTGSDVRLNGEEVPSSAVGPPPESLWEDFSWPDIAFRESYPVLQIDEAERTLDPSLILRENPRAEVILIQTDPSGDDWGATGTFTYPAELSSGVLDGIYLEVARDDTTTYVQIELAAPVEGEERPFVAVAFDVSEGGQRDVGYGAGYRFAQDRGYELLVLLGDGMRIVDERGRELGGLAPGSSALDAATGVVSFALPQRLLPPLEQGAHMTVLIGARDAGSGVGAFRSVAAGPAGEQGGGRVERSSANVYDVISGRVSR